MSSPWFDTMDLEGETPVSRAVKSGHPGLLDFILRQDQKDGNEDAASDSLLHRAAYWGLETAIKKLLFKGADPAERDGHGETPLHKAVRQGHREAVEALLENGADVNVINELGMTPLHWTALNGRGDVAEILLSYGADVNVRDEFGNSLTPLGLAKLMGYDQVAELIGARGGAY